MVDLPPILKKVEEMNDIIDLSGFLDSRATYGVMLGGRDSKGGKVAEKSLAKRWVYWSSK